MQLNYALPNKRIYLDIKLNRKSCFFPKKNAEDDLGDDLLLHLIKLMGQHLHLLLQVGNLILKKYHHYILVSIFLFYCSHKSKEVMNQDQMDSSTIDGNVEFVHS